MPGTVRDAVQLLLRSIDLYPPQGSSWPLAEIPDLPSCIVVDGWLSQSNDKHYTAVLRTNMTSIERREPQLAAFSYSSKGKAYGYWHTLRPLRVQVPKLTSFLEQVKQPSVLIAYSVGGAIALLSLGQMLEDLGSEWLRSRIPSVVLVHPAIGGAEELRSHLVEEGFIRPGVVPPIIRNLAFADGVYATRARAAISSLLDGGLAMTLLCCPYDRLVPPAEIPDTRLWNLPYAIREREPYLEHIRLRTLKSALDLQYYLAKPFITWS